MGGTVDLTVYYRFHVNASIQVWSISVMHDRHRLQTQETSHVFTAVILHKCIFCLFKTNAGRLFTVSKCLSSVTGLISTKNADSECFHQWQNMYELVYVLVSNDKLCCTFCST